VMGLHAVDDGLQVGGSAGERDAAEAVVAAQLQYEDGYRLLQHPADAAFSTCRSLAAEACVDHPVGQVQAVDLFADEGWEGFGRADAIAGCEAIAEEENGLFCRGRRGLCSRCSGSCRCRSRGFWRLVAGNG